MNRKSEHRGLASSSATTSPPTLRRHDAEEAIMARDDVVTATATTTTTATVPMVACSACGHMVPEWNLTIHQARACPGNAPRVAMNTSTDPNDMDQSNEHEGENNNNSDDDDDDFMEVYDAPDHHHHVNGNAAPTAPPSTWDTTTATPGVPLAASARNVIDLTSPDNEIEEQWTCERCTLFNDITDRFCAACGQMRPRQLRRRQHEYMDDDDDDDDDCRTPDPIRREQLLPNVPWQSSSNVSSSSAPSPVFVGGGALVGGVLGAAGAFLRGQSMSSALLEGAVTGAVGAAVAQQAWQQTPPPRLRRATNAPIPTNRASRPTAAGAAAHSSNDNHVRPRSSMRVVTHVTQNGSTRTTVTEQGRTTVHTRASNNHRNADTDSDALLAALQQIIAFSPLMLPPGAHHPNNNNMNIDGMSYDQLLEAFGDGTEGRRGASEGTIHSLPTQVLQQDPPKEWSNNPELQTCSICLEPYQKGQSRKCLPCLHGFHQHCIDPWLRSNASCPICKHQLS